MPFYSIIIPCYNSASTIYKCLKSLVDQSFNDFEIIIQDNFSSDETLGIITSFNDQRISVYTEKDIGVYDAMNRAINKAKGRWYYFLGSDDILFNNNVLENMKHHLDQNDATLVYGNVKINGSTAWAEDGTIYGGEIELSALFKHNISHQSIFYSRKIFDDGNRYKLKYKVCADYDFNLLCIAKYRVKHVSLIVANFYAGGLSTTSSDDLFAVDMWVNIITYFRARLFNKNLRTYRKNFKRTGKQLLKSFQLRRACIAYLAYLYQKIQF